MTADPITPALGVIMAGGQGLRMQASGAQEPKPLVTVLGAPLVERNVTALLRNGIRDIRVVLATGLRGEPVAAWCAGRGAALVAAAGGRLTVVEEQEPLGNCGGLALAIADGPDEPDDALLLFADNLTDLDLKVLVDAHRDRRAALTLAVHDEPFRLPYGVVDSDADGTVSAYREKPTVPIRVGSGIAVVSAAARALLAGPAGLSDLANACVRGGLPVVAYPHRARWIDVNDTAKAHAAEDLIRSAPAAFELFWSSAALAGEPTSADAGLVTGAWIDDLDASGQPIRVSTATSSAAGLDSAAWRRVRAWQSPGVVRGPDSQPQGRSAHRA